MNLTDTKRGPFSIVVAGTAGPIGRGVLGLLRYAFAGFLSVLILYLSLVTTSAPMTADDRRAVERAIVFLESRGFEREAFLLNNVATFRSSDNWLNQAVGAENAYAATNYPFGIITIYPDFAGKAVDDTERAMVLLHEARHLMNETEAEAYAYVWRERQRLGWTQLSHGTTETFITVELQTREHAPELFTCRSQAWNDCTETMTARRVKE